MEKRSAMHSMRYLLALCATVLSVWIHLSLFHYAVDDAYIHFRIAENFAQFGKPYFELDRALLTTSSPLWTLVLVALSVFPGALPLKVSIMNSLLSVLCCIAWTSLLPSKKLFEQVLVFLCFFSVLLTSSVGLMETGLALLLVALSLKFYELGKWQSFLCLGLGIFVRLEVAVFLVALLGINSWQKRIRVPLLIIGLISGSLVPVLFLASYFPFEIPQTILAKSVVYDVQASSNIQVLFRALFGSVLMSDYKIWVALWLIVIFVGMVVIIYQSNLSGSEALRAHLSRQKFVYICGLSSITVLLVYLLKGVLIFSWYAPLIALPLLYSLQAGLLTTSFRVARFVLCVSFIPFLALLANNVFASAGHPERYTDYQAGTRVRHYLQLGKELDDSFPFRTLMASEVGALGYTFSGKLIDGVGLITPEALKYHPLSVPEQRSDGMLGSIPLKFIEDVQPDLIVSYDIFLEEFLHSDLRDQYEEWSASLGSDEDVPLVWSAQKLYVFVRREITQSSHS